MDEGMALVGRSYSVRSRDRSPFVLAEKADCGCVGAGPVVHVALEA